MKNINLLSPLCETGYGLASLNILVELSKLTRLGWFPIGSAGGEDLKPYTKIIQDCYNNGQMYEKGPSLKIYHQNHLAERVGHPHIGFPFFELDTFNSQEKKHLSSVDHLFVTCEWAKQVVISNIPELEKKISIVPLGVDINIFTPVNRTVNERTVFLHCGKHEVRKGVSEIVECFNKAFEPTDSVELWLLCDNMFFTDSENSAWKKKYRESKMGNKIKPLARLSTQEQLSYVMQRADVGVFPAKGEAWNLENLEMLSCGKHIITTNYSGHTAYVNNNNAHLVEIDELEWAFDGKWFDGKTGRWAKLGPNQLDCIVDHMRTLHKRKQENGFIINNEGIKTAEQFTWTNTAKTIERHIDELT